MNLMMLLDMAMSGHPARVAIGRSDDGLSYEELYRRAGIAAARIRRDGVAHVAYVGTNSPAFAVAVFASSWAGVPILPINYRLGHEQVTGLLDQHEDVLVIADELAKASLSGVNHPVIDRDGWMASTAIGPTCEEWPNDPEGICRPPLHERHDLGPEGSHPPPPPPSLLRLLLGRLRWGR